MQPGILIFCSYGNHPQLDDVIAICCTLHAVDHTSMLSVLATDVIIAFLSITDKHILANTC